MANIGVFSLADVLESNQRRAAAEQQYMANQMKIQDVMRAQAEQRTLGDLYSKSMTTQPGIPAVPFQTTEEQEFGLPPLQGNVAQESIPGRTELDYNKLMELARGSSLSGISLANIHSQRQNEEYKQAMLASKNRTLTDFQRDLRAAGIDPASDEGRGLLRDRFNKNIVTPGLAFQIEKDRRDTKTRKDDKIDRGVEALSKRLNEIMGLRASFKNLNSTLSQYSPEGDVPGLGYGKTLPGAEFFLTEEGKKVRSSVTAVANDLLKLYSGGAVTPQENERRMVEMMASGNYTPKDLYNALPVLASRINDTTDNIKAGYNKDIVEQYINRPGAPDIGQIVPTGGKAKNPAPDQGGTQPIVVDW